MLANALWYEFAPETAETGISFGNIKVTYLVLIIGFTSNFVSIPITLLIVMLFKYSKVKTLKENRIEKALQKESELEEKNMDDDAKNSEGIANEYFETYSRISSSPDQITNKRLSLPYYCLYLGWMVFFLVVFASSFFLWEFGVKFGNDKKYKWLSSTITGLISDFILLEPLKVCVINIKYAKNYL